LVGKEVERGKESIKEMKIYREKLLDYYKNPRCWGDIDEGKDVIKSEKMNVSCGDKVEVSLIVKDGVVEKARFKGEGCAVCLGSASMLMEKLEGEKVTEVEDWDGRKVMRKLTGEIGEGRRKCQMLAWETLKDLIKNEKKEER